MNPNGTNAQPPENNLNINPLKQHYNKPPRHSNTTSTPSFNTNKSTRTKRKTKPKSTMQGTEPPIRGFHSATSTDTLIELSTTSIHGSTPTNDFPNTLTPSEKCVEPWMEVVD
ncbi:unnamed protein product, partial [Adineta ricciae]